MERTFLVLVCLHLGGAFSSHREHKVHNIVLYPDKHSWCKTTAIKQVVNHPGCEQAEVENNVCVGGCFSYSIPRTEPTAPGQVAPYCDSCQPSHATWKHVTLKCNPSEVDGGSLSKRVEVIEDCTCSACSGQQGGADRGGQEQHHPQGSDLDVPQLMNLVHSTKMSNATTKEHIKHDISHDSRLAMLLKVLSGGEEDTDHEALKEIISQIRGEDHHAIDQNTLEDIAHKAEEMSHIQVDMTKLDTLLSKLEPSEPRSPSTVHRHHHHHVHGPHHSLVNDEHIYPSPTLDMAPHHLKPAEEGSEITYQAHPESSISSNEHN